MREFASVAFVDFGRGQTEVRTYRFLNYGLKH